MVKFFLKASSLQNCIVHTVIRSAATYRQPFVDPFSRSDFFVTIKTVSKRGRRVGNGISFRELAVIQDTALTAFLTSSMSPTHFKLVKEAPGTHYMCLRDHTTQLSMSLSLYNAHLVQMAPETHHTRPSTSCKRHFSCVSYVRSHRTRTCTWNSSCVS